MSYELILGDRAYSSWSLRGWLLFEISKIPRRIKMLDFLDDTGVAAQLADYFPARTVPTLLTPEGAVISESLAIAEELATRHPTAGIWPSDPLCRATARTLVAEMHSGFAALRTYCPMNLRVAYKDVPVPDEVKADLERLDALWTHARQTCQSKGPWLCGDYSAVDAFFAPVAARIAGYDLPVSDVAKGYVAAHLADPAFRRWRAMGLVRGENLPWYARDYATQPWPGPTPVPAKAVETGTPENDKCPYSGDPVTHLMESQGRVFGFCNAFCRDKTVPDPDAWTDFVAMRDGHAENC